MDAGKRPPQLLIHREIPFIMKSIQNRRVVLFIPLGIQIQCGYFLPGPVDGMCI